MCWNRTKRAWMECKLNESVSEKYLPPWDRQSFPVGADPPPRNMFSDACSRYTTRTFTLIFLFLFFIHGGEKRGCCQSSKWVWLCCPNLPDRCFISSDGCFLAVTTVHVLNAEKKTVWFSALSLFKVTFCFSSSLSARFLFSSKFSLCLRDLPRVSDESAGKYYPRIDKGVSSGHGPNLHYNYPPSLRLHGLTIIAYIITTTWSTSQRHNVNLLFFVFLLF